ncbi:SNF2-related protein [Nocardiopsis dassonvillei]|uniref:SNF2-related protein n=1 Tax=Nocardiopsis dassonvillei TaxID=2014 RepID=UPI003670359A
MVQPAPAVEALRFRPSSQNDLAQSGERRRVRNNIAVIRLLRALEDEQRPATAEEQQVLARWSGWGAVPKVFDARSSEFAAERAELLELFSPEEYEAAKTNTLNAHYTDFSLVQGVWEGMRGLGFEGGNVLEPGCGSGNFIGAAPDDTSTPTRMVGVEVDPTTAAIARHLYPDAQILGESFAATVAPDGAFDAAIGNVPFGDYWLYDPRYNPSQETIHNHFISKSLDLVKPGGIVAVITSRWTMDAEDPAVRQKLAAKADLVGAVRLPRNAHAAAAGTTVVTDVLFLRRREPGREPAPMEWDAVVEIEGPAGVAKVNSYFVHHPEHVAGQLGVRKGQWGPEIDVTAPAEETFTEAVQSVVAQARERELTTTAPDTGWEPLTLTGADLARQDGLMQVDANDRLTRIIDGLQVEMDPPVKKHAQELFALLRLRDVYLELVAAQRDRPVGDEYTEELRATLNERYDAYVARYGPINRFGYKVNGQRNYPKLGGLRQDLLASRVLALEKFDPDTQVATKADIFSERTVAPPEKPQTAESAADALAISLDEFNEVRLEVVQQLLGADTPEQARQALGTLVYTEPVTERLVPAPEYLSGNVRAKLAAAQAAAATDEAFAVNVQALTEVQPVDLTPAEIEARLGATWISAEYVQQFARELLDDPKISVENGGASYWRVSGGQLKSVLALQTWGTTSMPAQTILQNILQNKAVKVTRTVEDADGSKRSVLDQAATEAAQAKAEAIVDRFAAWAWEDPDRARDLTRTYNAKFNALALRTYSGEHLSFPGLSERFVPREHQRDAVARVLSEPATLLGHGVGAGKTAEMVISVMEMRRLGQARKPAMVVPNHMLEQFSREFAELYPQANILVADKDMMSADYRARFADMAASGDWDAIIFSHNQFKNLPLSNVERQAYEDRQIAEYEEWIEAAEADPDVSDRTVKQLQQAKVQQQNRFKKIMSQVDAGSATLEDCGIDAIVVDEAHEHKNAMVRSNIQDAAKEKPAWQAEDLMMKGDYIRKIGGKLVFSTATPVANSVAEAYVIIRFLCPDLLHAAGIHDFDQWASTFGEITTDFEMKPEGGGFQQKDRFARFMNVPELLRVFHTFADIKLADELGLDLPQLVRPGEDGGPWVEGRQTVVVPPSPELLSYMEDLGARAEKIRRGAPELRWSEAKKQYRPDNMLWISSDGRAAALDTRLVGKEAAENTKIMAVADEVYRIWEEHKDDVYVDEDTGEEESRRGSLQMVFCELGTPNNDPSKYDAYEDLREHLVAKGMPREQIRFAHEASNDRQKGELFASCRDGRTQVIVGSTKKMGTGTNMQRRAVALHHVDCPWRPVDIEQREGRLVRQGNANQRVRILSYATEGSFDAYMWQTALRKLRFIDQLMRGKLDVREIEDISSNAMSYAEVQALASGNPLVLERAINEKLVKKLARARATHYQSQEMLRRTITAGETEIANATAAQGVFDQAIQRRTATRGDAFHMVINERGYDKRTDAADALRQFLGEQVRMGQRDRLRLRFGHSFAIGELGGFPLTGELFSTSTGEIQIVLSFPDLPTNNLKTGRYALLGATAHTFKTVQELATSTGHGVVMSLENTLRELEARRAEAVAAVPRIEAEVKRAQDGLGQPFARQAELDAALVEEARIRKAMGMPLRSSDASLVEGAGAAENPLEEAVHDALVADAIGTLAAVAEASPDPMVIVSDTAQPSGSGGSSEPRGTRPRGAWRNDLTPEERLAAQERFAAATRSGPAPVSEPDAPAPAAEEESSTPAAADTPAAANTPVEQESAAPAPGSEDTPEAVQVVSPPPGSEAPSTAAPEEATVPQPSGEFESLEEQAGASIGLLMLDADQRAESDAVLRAQLHSALEGLLIQGHTTAVADLVRRANRVDPDHIIMREGYRSRADFASPDAQVRAVDERLLRIEEDFNPGGTGIIRNLGEHPASEELRPVLERNGFEIDGEAGEALLLNGDPTQRFEAWQNIMQALEEAEESSLTRPESLRITEEQWQVAVQETQRQAQEPEAAVEQSIEPPAAAPEVAPSPVQVAEPEPAAESELPSEVTADSDTPTGEDTSDPTAPEQSGVAAQAPEQQQEESAQEPVALARAALRRMDTSFQRSTIDAEWETVQRSIDYLVDADRHDEALTLINDANRIDPTGAWGREEQRSRLMWRGPEAEERALNGPVIRIEHDGHQNTVVRGTDKEDSQVRSILKDLKFRWSRRLQFWHLQSKLNAPEQRSRVAQLLTRLDRLGRDRIAEPVWKEIDQRAREQQHSNSEEVIDRLRPAVDSIMQQAQQEGTYRQAITAIDALHRGLREQGHVTVGDAPGTGDRMPFADERQELMTAARARSREIADRFNTLMSGAEPDLDAALVLFEELEVTVPVQDLSDAHLEQTRASLTRRIEQAQAVQQDTGETPGSQAQESVEQAPEAAAEKEVPAPASEGQGQAQAPASTASAEPAEADPSPAEPAAAAVPSPSTASESSSGSDPGAHAVVESLRSQVEQQMQNARRTGHYRLRIGVVEAFQQHAIDSQVPGKTAASSDRPPFEEEIQALLSEARGLTQGLQERFEETMNSPDPDLGQALNLLHRMRAVAPEQDVSDAELDAAVETVYTRMDQIRSAQPQAPTAAAEQAAALAPETVPEAPEQEHAVSDDEYEETVAEGQDEQLAARYLRAQVEAGLLPYPQVYNTDGTIRRDALAKANDVLARVSVDDRAEPDSYDDVPDDLYEEGSGDPYERDGGHPVPDPAQAVPPLRASIDISGVAPYPDKHAAERATWWIAQNGLSRWESTSTAAEMSSPRSLPSDDVMALDRALHQARENPLVGGAGASAVRYADLGGAASTVFERIDDDRHHLAQAATLAAEHAARLQATREYNLARMQGATPVQLQRLENRQSAVRYTGEEEAREASEAIGAVVSRWARTATSRQMRDSFAQGADVARVRQVWEQVADGGLQGGPGPAAARFEGFSRAVGELNMRLEAETGHLRQLSAFANRHAARLAATQEAMATARSGGAEQQRAPQAQQRPQQRWYQVPDQDQGMGL